MFEESNSRQKFRQIRTVRGIAYWKPRGVIVQGGRAKIDVVVVRITQSL